MRAVHGVLRLLAACLLAAAGAGCTPDPAQLPADWPLPQLTLPDSTYPVALSDFAPPDRPYYNTSSDDAIRPALAAIERLLGGWDSKTQSGSTFSGMPALSAHGDSGRAWGVTYQISGGGFDNSLAECERSLLPLGYSTETYVAGMLRTYVSADRTREVVLVTGRRWQLLLAVVEYNPPLPSPRELAQREDAALAAREFAEALKTYVLEREGL